MTLSKNSTAYALLEGQLTKIVAQINATGKVALVGPFPSRREAYRWRQQVYMYRTLLAGPARLEPTPYDDLVLKIEPGDLHVRVGKEFVPQVQMVDQLDEVDHDT